MALSGGSAFGETHTSRRHTQRRGTGFLVEALFVLALLMACIAVFVRLFSAAQIEGVRANRTSEAVIVATNVAEEFCADPAGVERASVRDGFGVVCEVVPQERTGGTYYEAHIAVGLQGETFYELDTSRYVSGGEAS